MAELDRRKTAYRTRRGLEGLAIAGKSTGEKAYGYIAARDSGTGQIEINAYEAAIVCRIFTMYADGVSPRSIAARLNAEGVPSPDASWQRKKVGPNSKKRRGKWVATAAGGHLKLLMAVDRKSVEPIVCPPGALLILLAVFHLLLRSSVCCY